LFTTTDTDIDRQFRLAETKLGSEGVANEYGRQYFDVDEPNAYKIDVIIFAADDECIKRLHTYAEAKFHNLNDTYRRYIARIDSDRFRRQYDSIVSDGDIVSKHNFRLPETIQVAHEDGGKEYSKNRYAFGLKYDNKGWTLRSEWGHGQSDLGKADAWYVIGGMPVNDWWKIAAEYQCYRLGKEWGKSHNMYSFISDFQIHKNLMFQLQYNYVDNKPTSSQWNELWAELYVRF
jgi:hypothetical protein